MIPLYNGDTCIGHVAAAEIVPNHTTFNMGKNTVEVSSYVKLTDPVIYGPQQPQWPRYTLTTRPHGVFGTLIELHTYLGYERLAAALSAPTDRFTADPAFRDECEKRCRLLLTDAVSEKAERVDPVEE